MATYVIGDVQGCYRELRALLSRVSFDRARDRIWFVGDLVNRGPDSLAVLRFVRALGERAVAVLGNHDLHLVCRHAGFAKPRADDTLDEVLAAPDAVSLIDWLRHRPMLHREGGWLMVHAGLLPGWSSGTAVRLAGEVERVLRGGRYLTFLENMYGTRPDHWSESLAGWDRLRVIVNVMTRIRFCTMAGRLEFAAKGLTAPAGHLPWFKARHPRRGERLLCGHWSALGLHRRRAVLALDTGCVWGGALTALRLDDERLFQVPSPGYHRAGVEPSSLVTSIHPRLQGE
jgi:bis(5'-nucleosyl)-tetraphosphatase (symmetrical)